MLEASVVDTTVSTVPAPPPPLVACGCGRNYDAQSWPSLPLNGYMADGDGGFLELRTCACGSTRAIVVAEVPS